MFKNNPQLESYFRLGPVDIFVGKKIKAIRKEIRQTAANFGERVNLTARQIYLIEAGRRHLQPQELLAICEYLDIIPISLYYDYPSYSNQNKYNSELSYLN